MKVVLKIGPTVSRKELNALFAGSWPDRRSADLLRPLGSDRDKTRKKAGRSETAPLHKALVYVCAYEGERLIGFAKVIGDGGVHGFLLDPTVAPDRQRRGIGRKLVKACAREARRGGVEWLHVDYEPALANFYLACGFSPTHAGLRNLKREL